MQETRIDRAAKAHDGLIPAWRVTNWDGLVYFQCGKCWKTEQKLAPSGLPEERVPHQPDGSRCAFCMKEARPYVV